MKDLKQEVLSRLQHLDGRYFESISTISIEEMLGIVEIEEKYHPDIINGSLLDLEHEFWDDYIREMHSERAIIEECDVAIRLLKDEGKFRMVEPVDEELTGTTVYVEQSHKSTQDFDIEVEEEANSAVLRITTEKGVYGVVMKPL